MVLEHPLRSLHDLPNRARTRMGELRVLRVGNGQGAMQPAASVGPFSLDRPQRSAYEFSDLGHRQPRKESQFHQLRRLRVRHFKPFQSFVQ